MFRNNCNNMTCNRKVHPEVAAWAKRNQRAPLFPSGEGGNDGACWLTVTDLLDPAIAHFDARIDRPQPHFLTGRGDQADEVGEADLAAQPLDRAEGGGDVRGAE